MSAKLQAFAVRDDVAACFPHRPFFVLTRGVAIRQFMDAAKDEKSELYRHPGDFSLWHIGEWLQDSGELVAMTPVKLGSALSLSEEV